MSTVQEIINNARFDCSTDQGNCPNERAIVFFNRSMKMCVRKIHLFAMNNDNIEKDHTINLVAGQGVYQLPSGSSTSHDVGSVPQLLALIEMSLLLDGSNPRKVRPTHYISQENSLEVVRERTPVQKPKIVMNGKDSFEIFPTPKIDVIDGIRMSYSPSPIDLLVTSTEDEIPVPHEYHRVIELGIQHRIHKYRRKMEEAGLAMQEFRNGMAEMIGEIADPYLGYTERKAVYPNNLM